MRQKETAIRGDTQALKQQPTQNHKTDITKINLTFSVGKEKKKKKKRIRK